MHQVFAIFLRDVKRILKNPVALVVTLGVAIIPSLYAWCNILANWDPYANTGNIPVSYTHLRYRFSHAAHNTENGSTVQRKKRRKARDPHACFATFSRFTHSGALYARYAVAPAWQSDQAVGTKPTPYLIAISQSQYHNARKTRQLRGIGQQRDAETDRNA